MVPSYREYASPAGLTEIVACLWENDSVRHRHQRVVPDGCIDLVWLGDEGLKIVGADTGPHVVAPLGASAAGIRLRPGLLTEEVLRRRAAPDPLVVAAARGLSRPMARVGEVAADLGVSDRQLRRRTMDAIGYGPKTLARVVRLRRLIALDGEELAIRAVLAGYASQSHMTEEVRRLTGTTPVRFLKDAALTAA